MRQWSPTQQAHTQRGAAQQQTAVAQEQAALVVEQTAVAAEEQAAVAIAVVSSAGALHNTARARQWVSGQGWLSVAAVAVRKTTEAMAASEEGQVQVAEVTHCLRSMFREQEEEAAIVAGEAVPLPQRTRDRAAATAEADTVVAAGAQAETVVTVAPISAANLHNSTLQSAAGVQKYGVRMLLQFDPQQPLQYVRCQNAVYLVRVLRRAGIHNRALQQLQVSTRKRLRQWRQTQRAATGRTVVAAVVVAAVAAVGEAAAPTAAEAAGGASKRSRRRRRIRRRANGAPRSCVLESGRWINLPRARRAAAGTIAAVDVCKQQHL